MNIRIHHFFDIIRDFGSGKEIMPHNSLHEYHTVADKIRKNPDLTLSLVVESDAICTGCIYLIKSECIDIISHRTDFVGKEDFNIHIDHRIMEICELDLSTQYTPTYLCNMASKYIENIEFIYMGNDKPHTIKRKQNVITGVEKYADWHNLRSF